MVAKAKPQKMSYADYLALERQTGMRYQFLDGEVFLMAGGTPRHAKIITNLTVLVGSSAGNRPCQPYGADLKIRVLATGLASYPDLSVICGLLALHPEDKNAVTNPTALFEVLSPSTEIWDRDGKFEHARQITTLQEYVLVSTRRVRVERFVRAESGAWTYTSHGPGERVTLPSCGVELDVDALYANAPPPGPDEMAVGEEPRTD